MINVILIAPRQCWHTQDLLRLQSFGLYSYELVYDTPPFFRRSFYQRLVFSRFISFEFLQRLWRIIFFPFWSIYIFLRVRFLCNVIHCHGLFALVISLFSFLPPSRIIFTPQGSDVLVLPFKNVFVKWFLSFFLPKLSSVTADSHLILDVCSSLSDIDSNKLHHIQNGIDFVSLKSLSSSSTRYDLCWPRGLSTIYQFGYFTDILTHLSAIAISPLRICIIGAYGSASLPISLLSSKNLEITFFDRLESTDFYSLLNSSRIIVSIPSSDSSPRTVYEAIALKKQLFLTKLSCFDWIPSFSKLPFLYSCGSSEYDAYAIIQYLNDSSSFFADYELPPVFYSSLNYRSISSSFRDVYSASSFL